jgi:uncharacterized protein (TIRG00374 family)
VQDALRHLWPRVHAGLEVIRRPKLLAIAIVINLFGWMVDVLIFWAYGQAFGLDIPFSAYLSLTVAVAIVTIFPITFGNIGTYEFVLVRVMGLYGVSSDQALAYALGTHIVSTAFVIALGMIAMWTMGVTPSEIFSFKKPAKKAETAVESAGVP